MQAGLGEVQLSVVGRAVDVLCVAHFLFVREQVAVDAGHFVHQFERLARLVAVGVLFRDLLVLDLVEVHVDHVLQLEHEVVLVLQ